MSIFTSMLIHCLLLTKMVFSENAFLTGSNSSIVASWGLKREQLGTDQRDTKYPLCQKRVPGSAPSGSCYTPPPDRPGWRRNTVLCFLSMDFLGEKHARQIITALFQLRAANSLTPRITGDMELFRSSDYIRHWPPTTAASIFSLHSSAMA
jgi:hypothetical protein